MARLYANENFPLPAVEALRTFGHDILTTYESGRAGVALPDEEVLAFAVAERRILRACLKRVVWRDVVPPRLSFLAGHGHGCGRDRPKRGISGEAKPPPPPLFRQLLITLNRKHFIRLHHVRPNHAGIIVCSFDLDYPALAQRIHETLAEEGSLDGQLIRINRPG